MKKFKRFSILGFFFISSVFFLSSNVNAMDPLGTICWQGTSDSPVYYHLNIEIAGDIIAVNGYVTVANYASLADEMFPVVGTAIIKDGTAIFSITGSTYSTKFYRGNFTIQLDDLSGQSTLWFETIDGTTFERVTLYWANSPLEHIECE